MTTSRRSHLGAVDELAEVELRLQGRSWRPAALVLAVVLSLAATLWLTYVARSGSASLTDPVAAIETATTGRAVFEWLTITLALVPVVLAPLLAGPLVALDREQGTLVPLLLTGLSAGPMVLGKTVAGVVLVVVVVVAGTPVLPLAALVGGVTPTQVAATIGVLVAEALVVAVVASSAGAAARSSAGAVARAALAVAALTVGPFLLAAAIVIPDAVTGDDPVDPAAGVLAVSPLAAVADVAGAQGGAPDAGTPLGSLRTWLHRDGSEDRPWWAISLAVGAAVGAAGLALSSRALRLPNERLIADQD